MPSGNTFHKALDGSFGTFFDSPNGNGAWVEISRSSTPEPEPEPETQWTVTFIALEGGTVNDHDYLTQTVSNGGNVLPVTAIPEGYNEFTGWSGDASGTANPLTLTNVTSDMTIYANFALIGSPGTVADNQPDSQVNLALLPSATLSGNAGNNGRGAPSHILYDPAKNDYHVRTQWNEYGVAHGANLGTASEQNAFCWTVSWSSPKRVNYITFGGTYPNQPQPNTMWKVQYLNSGRWNTIAAGQGGWINSGIFQWGGESQAPVIADAVRVILFSDGTNNLTSMHLRARGGISFGGNDTARNPKATLIQYLGGH